MIINKHKTIKYPYYVFNPRHGLNFYHRTTEFLRYLLEKKLVDITIKTPTNEAPYIYRTMMCARDLNMGLVSLASLAACTQNWPKIEMCIDESLTAEEVKTFYRHHGLDVTVWTHDSLIERLEVNNELLLKQFSEAFFWGRKTAFTFGITESVPILYSDLDVLWFKDPWDGLNLNNIKNIISSVDIQFSYDKDYISLMSKHHQEILLSSPPFCAGLYALPPGCKLPDEVLGYLAKTLQGTKTKNVWEKANSIEQTSLGLATKLQGKEILREKVFTCPPEKLIFPSMKGKDWIAGHYAGGNIRWQFWRDAWSLLDSH